MDHIAIDRWNRIPDLRSFIRWESHRREALQNSSACQLSEGASSQSGDSRELFGGISRGGRCARAWTRCPDRSCRSGPIARCRRAWHQDRPPRCSSTQPGLDTGRAAVDPHPKPSVTTMEVVLYRARSARDVTDSVHQHGSWMDAHRAFEGSRWIAILPLRSVFGKKPSTEPTACPISSSMCLRSSKCSTTASQLRTSNSRTSLGSIQSARFS